MTRVLALEGVEVRDAQGYPMLSDITLEVMAGGLTGILTSEASARSLARVCLGLQPPSGGLVQLLGTDLSMVGPDARRRLRVRCGVMLSPGLLVSNLTALDNVSLPVCWAGKSQQEARKIAMDVLERWRLGGLAQKRPAQLAPGEQRMVALARVVADAPELAVLEQPQLDGDLRVTRRLVDMVKALQEQGAGVLLISSNQRLGQLLPGNWRHLVDTSLHTGRRG